MCREPGVGTIISPNECAGMHYNLAGNGRLIAGTFPASLTPHTLIILPPMTPFRIEAGGQRGSIFQQGNVQRSSTAELTRYVAGDGAPEILLICGFFRTPTELITQEIDAGAMTASSIKQAFIVVLRRSFSSREG